MMHCELCKLLHEIPRMHHCLDGKWQIGKWVQ